MVEWSHVLGIAFLVGMVILAIALPAYIQGKIDGERETDEKHEADLRRIKEWRDMGVE